MACEVHSKETRKGSVGNNGKRPPTSGNPDDIYQNIDCVKFSLVHEKIRSMGKEDENPNAARRSFGFPLNQTFTTFENLWEMVRQTRMHEINLQHVEFALKVYVEAHPSNILSVWVFLAAWIENQVQTGF